MSISLFSHEIDVGTSCCRSVHIIQSHFFLYHENIVNFLYPVLHFNNMKTEKVEYMHHDNMLITVLK